MRKLLSATGSLASILGSLNPFRYRGYVYDEETGLYYLRNRFYSPDTCKFFNADEIEYLGTDSDIIGNNLFTYCNNSPVSGYDPDGNWNWDTFWKGVTLAATVVAAVAVSVATLGAGTPVAMAIVAGVTMGSGILTGVNAAATIVEAATDYNVVRDGVFNEVLGLSDDVYDTYSMVTSTVAQVGTAVCGAYHTTGRYKASVEGRRFLGKGASSANKGRWVSADRYRQIRIDNHKPFGKHINLETWSKPLSAGTRNKLIEKETYHVPYKLFSYTKPIK